MIKHSQINKRVNAAAAAAAAVVVVVERKREQKAEGKLWSSFKQEEQNFFRQKYVNIIRDLCPFEKRT